MDNVEILIYALLLYGKVGCGIGKFLSYVRSGTSLATTQNKMKQKQGGEAKKNRLKI